jgi:hypothetical protein
MATIHLVGKVMKDHLDAGSAAAHLRLLCGNLGEGGMEHGKEKMG